METEELKSQRMPSELSSDCTPSVCIAESNHETNTSATSATTRPRMVNFFNSLILIRFQVVYIQYLKLKSPHHQSRGIDALAVVSVGKELSHQFRLPLLKTLHAKGHSAQTGNLLLGVTQCQVTQETLVVFVDFLVDQRLLFGQL